MSPAPVLIDDHLLVRILRGDPPSTPLEGREIATTGLWFHRLARALTTSAVTGALSRAIDIGDVPFAALVAGATISLPSTVSMISLRELAWPMAYLLEEGARLNLISLEALAAAEHLGADICLAAADHNQPLIDAATARAITVRVLD